MPYEHDYDAERKERIICELEHDPIFAQRLAFAAWIAQVERDRKKRERQEIAAYGQEER